MKQQKLIRGPAVLGEMNSSGRATGHEGNKNFYLDKAIPGETVTYTLERRKKGFLQGRPEKILSISPYRSDPFCVHVNECGGCNWQHIAYDHQLALKREILIRALEKYGIETPPVPSVIPSPVNLQYRHRIEYAFSSYADHINASERHHKPGLGFHAASDPGNVHAISECYLQEEPSRSICDFITMTALSKGMEFYNPITREGFLRSLSIRVNLVGEVMVVLGISEDYPANRESLMEKLKEQFPQIVSLNYTRHLSHEHSQMQGEMIPVLDTRPFIFESISGFRFRIHASSFFQPNVRQAGQIFNMANEWAELHGNEQIYDLYTGVGTLALFMAPSAGHVTGIEGSSHAIEDAVFNAELNNITNADFICGDILETFKEPFIREHGKPDLIVLDPPRSGTLIEIKKTINASGASKIIYLSCNPVSLAWDLKQLCEVYKITAIQPFDMLPHTHHLETLVMMERRIC